MLLKLNTGIATQGIEMQPGDIVDWHNDEDAERFIKRGLAVKASKDDVQSAGGKVKTYTPPKALPEDKWPPGQLKKLERDSGKK
jgi:hypothetical protein